MRLAVLSDIHGNLPALTAVIEDIDRWQPDTVIVAGDIISRGPCSGVCLEVIMDRADRDGWTVIRGNHEDMVLDCGRDVLPASGPQYEMTRFAHFAYGQVSRHASWLADLPDMAIRHACDGSELRVVHASMISNRDGIFAATSDEELREQIDPAPAVFVTGHTHRPLIRRIDDTTVVNIGSVGSSFDLDRRAGYGRFVWQDGRWQCEVTRLGYDYAQIEEDYMRSGFLELGGAMAQLMLVELRRARGLIFRWATRYEAAVLEGRMSVEASVRLILADEDVRPFTGPPGWTV